MSKELRDDQLREQLSSIFFDDDYPILTNQDAKRLDEAIALIASQVEETAKAYGGCTDCYGKGYATVNDRWHGYGTDGDIGGFEGRVSGGNPNAIKFCKCERGKQLAALIKSQTNQAVLEALDLYEKDMQGYNFTPEDYEGGEDTNALVADALKNSKEYVRKQITQEVQTDE